MPLATHRLAFFQFFTQNWPNGRTIKVGGRVKVSGAIIRAVLLTQSGFNDKILNKIRHRPVPPMRDQLDWASFKKVFSALCYPELLPAAGRCRRTFVKYSVSSKH